jgi:hypothetical protein
MKWSMVMAVMIAVARVADAAEPGQLPAIHLQMDNDADVPAAVLKKSQDEVTRIFADAGLGVEWTETGPRLTVQIVPSVLGYARAASPVMGVALRPPSGATARIFFNQVRAFARTSHVDVSTLLAYVIAHEIGHLLLPRMPHSATGLMKADWDRAVVREATAGSLTFTDAQIKRILASADAGAGSGLSSP